MTTYANANDRPAGVTSDGRLQTEVVQMRYQDYVTGTNEAGYTMYLAAVTPTGAADTFFSLTNTDPRPCLIQEVRYYDAHAGEFIHLQTGASYTLVGGTAVEPVNRKVGSTLLASSYATIEYGVDITGNASATVMESQAVQNTETTVSLKTRPIVLAQNRCFELEASAGTGAIRVEVDFCWLDSSDYVDN
jgi:hypothetical protein